MGKVLAKEQRETRREKKSIFVDEQGAPSLDPSPTTPNPFPETIHICICPYNQNTSLAEKTNTSNRIRRPYIKSFDDEE